MEIYSSNKKKYFYDLTGGKVDNKNVISNQHKSKKLFIVNKIIAFHQAKFIEVFNKENYENNLKKTLPCMSYYYIQYMTVVDEAWTRPLICRMSTVIYIFRKMTKLSRILGNFQIFYSFVKRCNEIPWKL